MSEPDRQPVEPSEPDGQPVETSEADSEPDREPAEASETESRPDELGDEAGEPEPEPVEASEADGGPEAAAKPEPEATEAAAESDEAAESDPEPVERERQPVKSSSPWWAKAMVIGGAMLMVVAGGGAVAAQMSLNLVNNSVNTEQLLPEPPVPVNNPDNSGTQLEGPLNFLVLGVDEQGSGRRSDSTIIVHVSAALDDVTIISLPRDLLVDIESCDPACSTKLTSAFSGGGETRADGFANSAATVTDLTGVQWDGAMIANFEGFIDLVDELGTIELCPWHEITSIHGERKTYPEGCAEYDKKDALDLVRQRYGWSRESDWDSGRGGDYGRQQMQQQAIMAILERAKELGYHTNPAKAVDLLNGFGENLTVDLGGMKLTDLIVSLREVDPADMTAIRTPSTTANINGTSYVVIGEGTEEQTAAADLWEAIVSDTLEQWECLYPEYVNGEPDCAEGAAEPAATEHGPR